MYSARDAFPSVAFQPSEPSAHANYTRPETLRVPAPRPAILDRDTSICVGEARLRPYAMARLSAALSCLVIEATILCSGGNSAAQAPGTIITVAGSGPTFPSSGGFSEDGGRRRARGSGPWRGHAGR